MPKIEVQSLNVSEKKGTVKVPVDSVVLNDAGIIGDAHAGDWHRQVSLLSVESISRYERKHSKVLSFGDFAENITTSGIELQNCNIFDHFSCGDILLEVTQIGKKCHAGCAISQETGDCVMPKEGIFARVLKGGEMKKGDELIYVPRSISVEIITLSDRASKGIYEDKSGPLAEQLLSKCFDKAKKLFSVNRCILPDDKQALEYKLLDCKQKNVDIVVTTGGTGIGPRDITPEVIKPLLDKEITGIMEMIRVKYGMQKPNALISRSVAGVMGSTLVYALPGSVKAVTEYLNEIMPTIDHSMKMIHGIDSH